MSQVSTEARRDLGAELVSGMFPLHGGTVCDMLRSDFQVVGQFHLEAALCRHVTS